ncbi:sorbosone dehydrogenase family protein [Phenylobacterium hankyongense]|uniref:Sorbosone dehydrogenase family protein n=1 Tax=Phenylobacterium hankyongense TaxID=1813876 RepID=A0A328AZJ8_9CAUL|nr:sorbosone dehydrogenase family protein [Phenylobacterium hankyongense]RAK60540.1 sorbosone dehydrogenase family protein [Phenylobacterium hankyongense]
MRQTLFAASAMSVLALAGCSSKGSSDPFVGFGPNPPLAAPHKSLIPTVGVPKVVGWPAGAAPKAPAGFTVVRYAEGLDHPRWVYVLPNGDTLVAESAGEPSTADKTNQGIKGFFQRMLMKQVGSARPSPNKIILLRDTNGDGVADTKTVFAEGLRSPFGMTLVGNTLYVANDNGVVKFPYADGQTQEQGPGEKVFDLPGPPINHHWTKNVVASPDGSKLYATVGSNSNVGENGLAAEAGRAAIWQYDIATGQAREYATGIRNPNGIAFEPTTGVMWTVSNERDEIGNDLPPDFLTSVKDGGFYGWPYAYWGQHADNRVNPQRPDMVAKAIAPDYGLGPHTASLSVAFYTADAFPAQYKGGAFIGQHGSWNRKPLNGYRVVYVPFAGGRPQMPAQLFLTGFLNADNKIQGRPVGVAVDRRGALLVADDVGGIVWRVAPTGG